MTLLSVQAHVQSILQGLTTPQLVAQGIAPAHAYIAPPAVVTDTMTSPEIYVWGGRMTDQRRSAPRNQVGAVNWTQPGAALPTLPITSAGFRNATWELDVWIMLLGPAASGADGDPANIVFPLLVDAVRKQLGLDLMAVNLTDQQTGDVTELIEIAERMTLEYTTPQETADERTLLYSALLTVSCREGYQL